jgi:predicted N-acetyltransferase YhbS
LETAIYLPPARAEASGRVFLGRRRAGAGKIDLRAETQADREAVDSLIDAAFGPGRFAKAAERLREGREPWGEISVTAWVGNTLAGAVRLWRIEVGETPAVLLGPIAVDASRRGAGLAQAMTAEACARAAEAGVGLVLLVGEERLFGPLGFFGVDAGRVTLPAPVDPRRLFVRELRPGAFDGVAGLARPGPLP